MEQKRCKNKKCRRILPEGYKYKYCERCRNERTEKMKNWVEGATTLTAVIGSAVLAIITKGKSGPKNDS